VTQKSGVTKNISRDTPRHAIATEQPPVPSVKITVYLRPTFRL